MQRCMYRMSHFFFSHQLPGTITEKAGAAVQWKACVVYCWRGCCTQRNNRYASNSLTYVAQATANAGRYTLRGISSQEEGNVLYIEHGSTGMKSQIS